MATSYKENKTIEVRLKYTVGERIKILEDKIRFYKNRLSEAKTLEESDKYTGVVNKIYFVLIPLKKNYSGSNILN
jgi:hypothetical protein